MFAPATVLDAQYGVESRYPRKGKKSHLLALKRRQNFRVVMQGLFSTFSLLGNGATSFQGLCLFLALFKAITDERLWWLNCLGFLFLFPQIVSS